MDGSNRLYRYSDILFWIYNSIVVIFLLLTGQRVECRWLLFTSNVGLIVLSTVLIHSHRQEPDSTFYRLGRNWYPFIYFSYLHWESGLLGNLFHAEYLDPLVKSWDLSLFGDYLHNILYQFQPLWFAEFVHFTYFSYYIMLFLPAVIFYRTRPVLFKKYVFDIALLYLVQYTFFYIFPVEGPIALHMARFPDGVLFIPLMKTLYKFGDSPGGALPSSHVSVAVLAWYYFVRYNKFYGIIAGFLTLCLTFSTVYLSYHYAIDAVAGMIVGIGFILLMHFLRLKYGEETFI